MKGFCRTCNKELPLEQYFCDDACQYEYWAQRRVKGKMTTQELIDGFKKLAANAPKHEPSESDKKKTIEQMTMDEAWEAVGAF